MEMTSDNEGDGQINSALLTKGEIEWLQRKRSDVASRSIKSRLLKKLIQFQSREFPLLITSGLWDAANVANTTATGFVQSEIGSEQSRNRSAIPPYHTHCDQEVLSRRRSRVQKNTRFALDLNKSRPEHSFCNSITLNPTEKYRSSHREQMAIVLLQMLPKDYAMILPHNPPTSLKSAKVCHSISLIHSTKSDTLCYIVKVPRLPRWIAIHNKITSNVLRAQIEKSGNNYFEKSPSETAHPIKKIV